SIGRAHLPGRYCRDEIHQRPATRIRRGGKKPLPPFPGGHHILLSGESTGAPGPPAPGDPDWSKLPGDIGWTTVATVPAWFLLASGFFAILPLSTGKSHPRFPEVVPFGEIETDPSPARSPDTPPGPAPGHPGSGSRNWPRFFLPRS